MDCKDFSSSSILVKDVMNKDLISVNITTPVFQIAKMMQLGKIGAILVKENDIHVGIITNRDFATKKMSDNKDRKLVVFEKGKLVGVITSTDLVNHLASVSNN